MEKEVTINELAGTVNGMMDFLRENMVTKAELATTVADLRSEMATKKDLSNTVAELRSEMATKNDLEALENKMDAGFRMVREEIRETNEQIAKLYRRTSEDVAAVIKDVFKIKEQLSFNS